MPTITIPTLHTLPPELACRILDHLSDWNILFSMQNVCKRINTILNSYSRYKVNYVMCRDVPRLNVYQQS